MSSPNERVEYALQQLKQGKMVILSDHPSRENGGDLIAVAETMTPEQMNFMIRHGTGIVCISLTAKRLQDLDLPLMVAPENNTSPSGTPFTVPVDAKNSVTTGVSAEDRIATVRTLLDPRSKPSDLVKPGHLFPLRAAENGVLQRPGHTEGGIDLARLAGFEPAAVLCEVMNPDGSMMRGAELHQFAKLHQLAVLSIEDIIHYRLQHENLFSGEASTILPLAEYGDFTITVVKEKLTQHEHVILSKAVKDSSQPQLVRIHSSCMTGDLFASLRCDCHQQLQYSLKKISEEGGTLIYLYQEGRGIGLLNKIKAYSLQDEGLDTAEASERLGFPIDSRQYYLAAALLRQRNISSIRLLTNNPNKIADLKKFGITDVHREPMPSFISKYNQFYLQTKTKKLNHSIELKGSTE